MVFDFFYRSLHGTMVRGKSLIEKDFGILIGQYVANGSNMCEDPKTLF